MVKGGDRETLERPLGGIHRMLTAVLLGLGGFDRHEYILSSGG